MELRIDEIIENKYNYNNMEKHDLVRLKTLIEEEGTYPPLIVNKRIDGSYVLLDGHQRMRVLKKMGKEKVKCDIWELPIQQELVALATINELKGKKNSYKKGVLLEEIQKRSKNFDEVSQLIERKSVKLEKMVAEQKAKDKVNLERKYQMCFFMNKEEYMEVQEFINSTYDKKDWDRGIFLMLDEIKKQASEELDGAK